MGFPGGSVVKNLPAMQETRVWSLDWEDPLEKEMATHSSILAWRIPWTEDPGRLQSLGLQRIRLNWATNTFTSFFYLVASHSSLCSKLMSFNTNFSWWSAGNDFVAHSIFFLPIGLFCLISNSFFLCLPSPCSFCPTHWGCVSPWTHSSPALLLAPWYLVASLTIY